MEQLAWVSLTFYFLSWKCPVLPIGIGRHLIVGVSSQNPLPVMIKWNLLQQQCRIWHPGALLAQWCGWARWGTRWDQHFGSEICFALCLGRGHGMWNDLCWEDKSGRLQYRRLVNVPCSTCCCQEWLSRRPTGPEWAAQTSCRRSGACIACLYKCASIIIYIVLCNSLGKKGAVGRQGAVKCVMKG